MDDQILAKRISQVVQLVIIGSIVLSIAYCSSSTNEEAGTNPATLSHHASSRSWFSGWSNHSSSWGGSSWGSGNSGSSGSSFSSSRGGFGSSSSAHSSGGS